jgi:hypothetical protein
MIIIGCDYHPGFQQIAFVDSDTGELSEARLGHKEEAEAYCNLDRTHLLCREDHKSHAECLGIRIEIYPRRTSIDHTPFVTFLYVYLNGVSFYICLTFVWL